MGGVSECVAFDLNVMKIVLKISEREFQSEERANAKTQRWSKTGRM